MSAVSVCYRTNANFIFGKKSWIQNSFRHTTNSSSAAAVYCADLVKKFDYENFLCTLLLTSQLRSLAFAVRAFNIEVSRVQDQVSQVQIGQMRLKFWLETIEKLFQNEVREHPVAIELFRTMKDKKLSKSHLKNLVNARMVPISSSSFKTVEDMEKYAESSVSPIYYLILQGSGLGSINADHAASHLGKSQGITNILRSVPYNTGNRIVALPQDLLLKYNLPQEKILRKKGSAELKEVIFEIASRAKQHLDKARNLKENCPKESSILFLPAVCIDSYLDRLRLADFDVFNENLQRRNNLIQLQLYWNKFLNKY